MPLPQEKQYTVSDIYDLPEGERAELIDGTIYYMTPPGRRHQKLVHFLDRTIGNYIQDRQGECEVYPAPFAVFLNKNDRNYVEPDISVIRDRNKLNDRGCNGAPDFIIEVVSPGSRTMDYMIKLFKYRSAGVREYWIADIEKDRILVYFFETEFLNEYTFSDRVKVSIYEDLEIDFSAAGV